ncbi:hypothetical protein ACK3SF_00885 [Candidatus Nanosalina sp. VS9-1]|uniref:hypothetical protein n=1 Tax=Candidatus Nanosalina sp. VS9-1 TaxID=3388566 RepID=UPI0039DF7BC0
MPDGKLVNVELDYSDVLEDVEIRGDFFLEPPKALEALESALEGVSSDASRQELVSAMQSVRADLIGFSREDIADTVLQAMGRGDEV